MRVVDLFCGCGGLSHGFEKAGFQVVLAVDFWEDAIRTYKHNFPSTDARCMDIHNCDDHMLDQLLKDGPIDGVIGGPPCQGFSTVGKRDINDPRNQLYLQFCRVVDHLNPSFFVIENVKGLLTLDGGKVRKDIEARFSSMGYFVAAKVLNAADFGVPQNRWRVFFVGLKSDLFRFPQPHKRQLSASEGISDLPSVSNWDGVSVISTYTKPATTAYQKHCRKGAKVLLNHEFTRHSDQTISVISKIPDGGNIHDLPPEYWQIRKFNKAFERMSSSRPANTVDTGHRNYFHYAEPRIPTVRENARLQSFPDTFDFLGTRGSQYKQVGNAVPPLLAYAIACEILNQTR